jgi:hypothetical protein
MHGFDLLRACEGVCIEAGNRYNIAGCEDNKKPSQ